MVFKAKVDFLWYKQGQVIGDDLLPEWVVLGYVEEVVLKVAPVVTESVVEPVKKKAFGKK